MSVVLDHLTAIIVGTVLLGALFLVQRGSQTTAIEATERYQTETQTAQFMQTVERDVDNIRTVAQTTHAFGDYRFTLRRATGTDGTTYTKQFTFATLLDPDLGNASEVAIVTYELLPTGESTRVGDQLRPLYNATRYLTLRGGTPQRTGGALRIADFDITGYRLSGGSLTSVSNIYETPIRVKVDIAAAPSSRVSAGTDSNLRGTRITRSVRIKNATATGGLPPVDTSLPPGIPVQPGDPPPPPPTSGTGTTGGPGGGTSTGGNGTGTSLPGPTPTPPDTSGLPL